MDNSSVFFISMEGRTNFKIGDFLVREDIPLPVYVEEGEKFTPDHINPDNIISGMIKILMENPENDHIDYYREFIFNVQPEIEARLSAIGYEAERNIRYNEAIDIYKVMIALKPDSINSILNIAVCYDEFSQYLFSKGRETEALKMEELSYDYFKILEDNDNKSENVYYYLGRFYLYRENYKKAITYFDDFIKITTDDNRKKEVIKLLKDINVQGVIDENYQTAYEMINSDKNEAAISYIDNYIQNFPDSWHGYYLKGLAYRKLEKYTEAIENLNKSLDINKESTDSYNELGLCFMNLKDYVKSQLYFTKALRLNPEDIIIMSNLAVLSFKRGNKQEAIKYCKIILEFEPNDLFTKDLLKTIEET